MASCARYACRNRRTPQNQAHPAAVTPGPRVRLAQGYALEWGWHLFGPYLKVACGLSDLPDEVLLADLRRTEVRIARTSKGVDPGR